ncbi:MAG: class I SAM-dependent methyltransferase [Pseudazoarcus pumilus]|nr:class I SAM-dependent methyltransferase [Pseudazoarcus pumilus]
MHRLLPDALHWRSAAALLLALACSTVTADIAEPSGEPPRDNLPPMLDVPYVPTPDTAVYRMLEMAEVQPDDYVIDLGSGDGRIVVAAARDWSVKRAMGVDIDPERIAEANENARKAGVEERVSFVRGNLYEMDFSDVDVLTMYLLPSINLDLRPTILEKLRPGTRVVSHSFDMGDWPPDQWRKVQGRYIYKWVVPARVNGNWRVTKTDGSAFTVEFKQNFQRLEGMSVMDQRAVPVAFAELAGPEIRFSVADEHYLGRVDGDSISPLPGKGVIEGWHAERI